MSNSSFYAPVETLELSCFPVCPRSASSNDLVYYHSNGTLLRPHEVALIKGCYFCPRGQEVQFDKNRDSITGVLPITCRTCERGEVQPRTSNRCEPCPGGLYSWYDWRLGYSDDSTQQVCRKCPLGSWCLLGKSHIAMLVADKDGVGYSSVKLKGYWHPNPKHSSQVVRCLLAEACSDGLDATEALEHYEETFSNYSNLNSKQPNPCPTCYRLSSSISLTAGCLFIQ